MPAAPERWPRSFVVDLGYLLPPRAWGFGYAAEASTAAFDWFDAVLPAEPVVLTTQTANVASMRLAAKLGFTELERFQAWDAEHWLGLRFPVTPFARAQRPTRTPIGRRPLPAPCWAGTDRTGTPGSASWWALCCLPRGGR